MRTAVLRLVSISLVASHDRCARVVSPQKNGVWVLIERGLKCACWNRCGLYQDNKTELVCVTMGMNGEAASA